MPEYNCNFQHFAVTFRITNYKKIYGVKRELQIQYYTGRIDRGLHSYSNIKYIIINTHKQAVLVFFDMHFLLQSDIIFKPEGNI